MNTVEYLQEGLMMGASQERRVGFEHYTWAQSHRYGNCMMYETTILTAMTS